MPDPAPDHRDAIEHHRSVAYQVRDFALQSGFDLVEEAGGRRIRVSGLCPGCGGRTVTTWDYGSGNGHKGIFTRRRPQAATTAGRERTVCCDCGHAHADRPESDIFLGCGAYWQVELP